MSYYKFLRDSEDHQVLKSCVEGNVMFSRIPELNDFSETFAVVDKVEMERASARISSVGCTREEIRNLEKHINLFENLPMEGLGTTLMNVAMGLFGQFGAHSMLNPNKLMKVMLKELPNILQSVNKHIQDNVGIFCITEKFDIFPMWAHYADEAKGFVVEYDNLEKLFHDKETDVLNLLKKVDYYSNERPAVQFSPSHLTELFFSKHEDWKYEREWRVIKPLSECKKFRKKIVLKNGEEKECERYFFNIGVNNNPEKYIKRIIVGWNGDLEDIRDYVKEKCDIPVVQAKVKDGNIVVSKNRN